MACIVLYCIVLYCIVLYCIVEFTSAHFSKFLFLIFNNSINFKKIIACLIKNVNNNLKLN